MKKKKVGIIGFGNFGKFLYKHLNPYFQLSVYDKSIKKNTLESVIKSDIIILAVPVSSFETVLKKISSMLNTDTLIIDVASVKVNPTNLMKKYLLHNPLLGLHPLFGPESGKNGIEGLSVIYSPIRIKKNSLSHIKDFLKSTFKVQLKKMSPEEHDKQMAYVQGITHFIGKALNILDLPKFKDETKAYTKLLEIKKLLSRTSSDLFDTIEKENPYAKKVRTNFLKTLENLENKIER